MPELDIIQDADRLNAIGVIGIARAFAFEGTRKLPLHTSDIPLVTSKTTHDEYVENAKKSRSVIQHFYDKLFHLKDMMKTVAGKQIAQDRHNYMTEFVDRFMQKWNP